MKGALKAPQVYNLTERVEERKKQQTEKADDYIIPILDSASLPLNKLQKHSKGHWFLKKIKHLADNPLVYLPISISRFFTVIRRVEYKHD